jgi:hypothetical protein
MFKLDDNLLSDLGLGQLPGSEKNLMLAHIYETLQRSVGARLVALMTADQLDEFGRYIDCGDEAGALAWLQEHFPGYTTVVQEELDELKPEIRAVAPKILAISTTERMQ